MRMQAAAGTSPPGYCFIMNVAAHCLRTPRSQTPQQATLNITATPPPQAAVRKYRNHKDQKNELIDRLKSMRDAKRNRPDAWSGGKEARNTPFCPSQEKIHTVVFLGPRKIPL